MNILTDNINNSTDLKTLVASFNLLPYNSMGTYPLTPLTNPLDTTCFQFEQGTIGWYWGYLTFSKELINIMFYIIRIDLGTEDLRQKYGMKLGESTAYYLSFGVGKNGDWHYTPYKFIGGSYETTTESTFKFTSLDDSIQCVFESTSIGTFHLNCSWKENNDIYGIDTILYSEQKPYFNGDDTGCAPCIAGAGTLYWSYTQLYNKNTHITFKGIDNALDDKTGVGWLDRQWINGVLDNNFLNYINNIVQSTKRTGGLGRYIWLNAHLDDQQYMITVMLDSYSVIQNNQTFDAKYYLYSPSLDNTSYDNYTQLKIIDVVSIDDITYPTKYEVSLNDINNKKHNYIIDSTPFGNTVTIDLTGNFHWSGSALLIDKDTSNTVGTAFLEANQFQDFETYNNNYFKAAGLSGDVKQFTQKSIISFSQSIPSILVFICYIIMIIIWIYILIKYIIGNNVGKGGKRSKK